MKKSNYKRFKYNGKIFPIVNINFETDQVTFEEKPNVFMTVNVKKGMLVAEKRSKNKKITAKEFYDKCPVRVMLLYDELEKLDKKYDAEEDKFKILNLPEINKKVDQLIIDADLSIYERRCLKKLLRLWFKENE